MPRDFKTYRQRLRSPFSSISLSKIQVSVSEEIPMFVPSSVLPPPVRLTKTAVIPAFFMVSIKRKSIE